MSPRAVFSQDGPPAGSHAGQVAAAGTPESVEYAVQQMVREAIAFDDAELMGARAQATEYYKGRPFGDEQDGRSQVVLTDVRDAVQQQLPSLARVFFGNADRVVRFTPRGPEDEEAAEQLTDYVQYVLTQDNPGFRICWDAWKDALVRRRGIIKWWWEDQPRTAEDTVEGLSADQMALLQSQGTTVTPLATVTAPDGTVTYRAHLRRTITDGRARIAAVPPEEFLQSRNARTMEDALLVGHRRELRRSDLIAMGVPEDQINQYGMSSATLEWNQDAITRAPNEAAQPDPTPRTEDQKVLYVEAFVYLDEDGDGIAEHRRICLLGTGLHIIVGADGEPWDEPWPERPFALYVPDPEPHTLLGLGTIDATADLQRIKSHVVRGILDSASFAVNPRTAVVENQVNLADVMNTEIGAVIRQRAPGMVQPLTQDFVGAQLFPMLDYLDAVKESRLGLTKASAGLDPDALQSSTRVAVEATVQAAQQRLELLCRVFAETGHKTLMLGLATLLHRHQPAARLVKLRGQWVPMDPQTWDPDPQVIVEVGLGTGNTEQRTSFLLGVLQKQEQMLQTLGPNNPACGLPQYLDALWDVCTLNGVNPGRYFNRLPKGWQAPPPPPPPPSPEQVLAQVEQMKAEKDIAIKQGDQALRAREMDLKNARDQDRLQTDAFLGAMELELKYKHEADKTQTAQLKAMAPLQGLNRGGESLNLEHDGEGRVTGGTLTRRIRLHRQDGKLTGATMEDT